MTTATSIPGTVELTASNSSTTAPKTGIGSTSFFVWVVTALPGALSYLSDYVVHGTPGQTQVRGWGGAALFLAATVGKLLHDQSVRRSHAIATGAELVHALPQLRGDIAGITGFVEHEWPGAAATFRDVSRRIPELEARVAAIPGVDEVVRGALDALQARLVGGAAPLAQAPVSGPGIASS